MLMSVRFIRRSLTPTGSIWKRYRTRLQRQRHQSCTQLLPTICHIWILVDHQQLRTFDLISGIVTIFLLNNSTKIDDRLEVLPRRAHRYVERSMMVERCFEAYTRQFRKDVCCPTGSRSWLSFINEAIGAPFCAISTVHVSAFLPISISVSILLCSY